MGWGVLTVGVVLVRCTAGLVAGRFRHSERLDDAGEPVELLDDGLPLAFEGGPMWRQLVYVQIGGLLLATIVTKGVVPLLYVVFVETFKVVEWKPERPELEAAE